MAANIVSEQELFFNSFEPKLRGRFILMMDGVPSYVIKKTSRPTLRQEAVEIPHINVSRYVKGKSLWQPITLVLYDPIVPSAAQAVMEWVRLGHESVTGRDGYAAFYKKDLVVNVLGPVGDVVEQWILKGSVVTEANFGDLDWATPNELVDITLTVQPDYAILSF